MILQVVRLSNAALGPSVHHVAPLPTLISLIGFFSDTETLPSHIKTILYQTD